MAVSIIFYFPYGSIKLIEVLWLCRENDFLTRFHSQYLYVRFVLHYLMLDEKWPKAGLTLENHAA
jgi:hypothetical protein